MPVGQTATRLRLFEFFGGSQSHVSCQHDAYEGLFNEGEFGWSPRNILCRSALHAADKESLEDVEQIFTTTGKLSGLGTTSPSTTRNQRKRRVKVALLVIILVMSIYALPMTVVS